MGVEGHESITQRAHAMEQLKSELLDGIAALARGQLAGSDTVAREGAAQACASLYLIGAHLGLSYSEMDHWISHYLRQLIAERQESSWSKELQELAQYLERRGT